MCAQMRAGRAASEEKQKLKTVATEGRKTCSSRAVARLRSSFGAHSAARAPLPWLAAARSLHVHERWPPAQDACTACPSAGRSSSKSACTRFEGREGKAATSRPYSKTSPSSQGSCVAAGQ